MSRRSNLLQIIESTESRTTSPHPTSLRGDRSLYSFVLLTWCHCYARSGSPRSSSRKPSIKGWDSYCSPCHKPFCPHWSLLAFRVTDIKLSLLKPATSTIFTWQFVLFHEPTLRRYPFNYPPHCNLSSMKMRATLGIYEDPSSFTSADVWKRDGSDALKVKIYAALGLLSMAAMTTYVAWKYQYALPPFFVGTSKSG